MKKTLKILSLLVIVSMLTTLVVACSKSPAASPAASPTASTSVATTAPADGTAAPASEPATKKLDPVDLIIYAGGDQIDQPGAQAVFDEIAKETADTINVHVKVQTYPWGDYINKVNTTLAAGEPIDIYLNFNGNLKSDAEKKQIIPLDDLVDKYGPALKKNIPADIWSDVKYNGKIYGIPAVYPFVGIDSLLIRGDLREKYKLPPVTDLPTLEAYLDAVTKGEKGMVGYDGVDGRGAGVANYFINPDDYIDAPHLTISVEENIL